MDKKILALDVGEKRIGIAIANSFTKLPRPLITIGFEGALEKVEKLALKENITEIVVGLPRNLSGLTTGQTKFTEDFIEKLKSKINLPVHEQDEALTSAQAEKELKTRGKPYNREDIDSLAAVYILEDYLSSKG